MSLNLLAIYTSLWQPMDSASLLAERKEGLETYLHTIEVCGLGVLSS